MDTPAAPLDEFFDRPFLPGIADDSNLGCELLEPEETQRTRYTGKIVDKNMERVQAILAARAMGFSIRTVCKGFSLSPHTLAELELRHRSKLATLKERLARKFGAFVELGLDRAIHEVGDMDIDKLMISLGIAADKLQVLTGEPSVIVGSSDGPRQFSIEALRERLGRREIIDVTPSAIGSEGEEKQQTRAESAIQSVDTPAEPSNPA